jgi:hypothetical protein
MCVSALWIGSVLISCIVYRISWLRAKARYTRWKEEHILVQHEMRWTVAWFDHRRNMWQMRYEEIEDEASSDGLRCYALKQANLWQRLGETSRKMFTATLGTVEM